MDWISIKEKKPQHQKGVLTIDPFYGIQVANYSISEDLWIYLMSNRQSNNITHWMELPPKPLDTI